VRYCRELKADALPDYEYLKSLLTSLIEDSNLFFDWEEKEMLEEGNHLELSRYGEPDELTTTFFLMDKQDVLKEFFSFTKKNSVLV